ncbi:hypothetical protein AB4851_01675 [Burkholderia sp. 22PA0099]|uniref:hypothetical protein n=1 Tax=Burkholderia sp. 22PA0099 TaxID=3237372 RepID=UPI0039C41A99
MQNSNETMRNARSARRPAASASQAANPTPIPIQYPFEYEKIGSLKRFKHNSLFYGPHSFCFIRQRYVMPTDVHATTGNSFISCPSAPTALFFVGLGSFC